MYIEFKAVLALLIWSQVEVWYSETDASYSLENFP